MSRFKNEVLKICVAQICQGIGFHGLYSIPLEVLGDIMSRYISEMAVLTHRYTEHYGRTEPNLEDLGLAFKEMGISLTELEEYVSSVDPTPFPHSLSEFPMKKTSSLNFLKPGSRETLSRPLHVHEHLPPMYPEKEEEETDSKLGIVNSLDSPVNVGSPTSDGGGGEVLSPGGGGVTKRGLDQSGGPTKKQRLNTDEEGRPVREVDSVMMTTGGFISSAREGKVPESKIPNIPMLLPRAVSPHPPTGLGGVRRKIAVEKIVRQKNGEDASTPPSSKSKPKIKPKLPPGQRPGSLPPTGLSKKGGILAGKLAAGKAKSGTGEKKQLIKTELPEHVKSQMMSNLQERPSSIAIMTAAALKGETNGTSTQQGSAHSMGTPSTPKPKKVANTPPKLKMPTPKVQKSPKVDANTPAKGTAKEGKEENKKKSKKDKEDAKKKEKVKKDKSKEKSTAKEKKTVVKKEKKEKTQKKSDKEAVKKDKETKKKEKEKKKKEGKDAGKKKDEKERKERELIAALAASSAVSITPLYGRPPPPAMNPDQSVSGGDTNKLSIFKKKGSKNKPVVDPLAPPAGDAEMDLDFPVPLDTPDYRNTSAREGSPAPPLTPGITTEDDQPKIPNSASFIPPFRPSSTGMFPTTPMELDEFPTTFRMQSDDKRDPDPMEDLPVEMSDIPKTPTLATPPPAPHKEKKKEHKKEKKEKDKTKKKKDKKAKTKEKSEKKKEKEKSKQDKRKSKAKKKDVPTTPSTPKLTVKLVSEQQRQMSALARSPPGSAKYQEPTEKSTPKIVIKPIHKPEEIPSHDTESSSTTKLEQPGSPEIAKFSALVTRPPKPSSDHPKGDQSTPKSSKHTSAATTPSVPSLSICKRPASEAGSGSPWATVPTLKIKNPSTPTPSILPQDKSDEKKASASTKKEKKRKSGNTDTSEPTPQFTSTPVEESTPKPRKSHPSTSSTAATPSSKSSSSSSSTGLLSETVGPIGHFVDDQGNEVWICPACGKQDDGSPMIGCDTCDDWYHWVCVGIQVPPSETENWYCPRCLSQHKQRGFTTSEKKKRGRKRK